MRVAIETVAGGAALAVIAATVSDVCWFMASTASLVDSVDFIFFDFCQQGNYFILGPLSQTTAEFRVPEITGITRCSKIDGKAIMSPFFKSAV